SCGQCVKGAANDLRDFGRIIGARIPLRDRFGQCKLVHRVEQASPFLRSFGVDLTGNEKDGNRVVVRNGQAGGRIRQVRPGREAVYRTELAGGPDAWKECTDEEIGASLSDFSCSGPVRSGSGPDVRKLETDRAGSLRVLRKQ